MAATAHDDSDLSERVQCHEHNEDGWCYWLKPDWEMPDGDKMVCEATEKKALAALKTAASGEGFSRLRTDCHNLV